MRKIIKSTDELPSIFDVNRYTNMDKLSAFDWFFLLQTRYLLHQHVIDDDLSCFLPIGEKTLSDDEKDEAIAQIIRTHFKNPLNLDLIINYTKHSGENIVIDISSSDYYSFMRRNLPVSELYEDQFRSIQWFIEQTSVELKTDQRIKQSRSVVDIMKTIDINLCLYDYPITINPFYPDHVIVDEFRKLLVKVREKLGHSQKNKSVSYKDLLNWASYKLLPYFDLKLLEFYEGIKITNSVICSILYPKGEYGEDNLRKSVEPIRRKILEQDSFYSKDEIYELSIFDSLRYLAYSEFDKNGKFFDQ